MLEHRAHRAVPAALVAGLAAVAPPAVAAQSLPGVPSAAAPIAAHLPPHRSSAAARRPTAAQDFLFGAPSGSLSFRIGRLFARTDGEVFAHTFRNLTVEPRDLDAIALGVDLAIRVIERADIVLGAGYSRSSVRSEFREWEDLDGLPIEQTTRFRQIPLTLGARLYVTPRGRSISRFAWIPARTALYVVGGVGVAHHSFEQDGDFVDFVDLAIFTDDLRSSGWAPLLYIGAGGELRVTTQAALVADVRYTRGSARAAGDFSGLEDIGLGGIATSVGVALTF